MVERTVVSDAPAPVTPPAPPPVDIAVTHTAPQVNATGDLPTAGRTRIEAVPAGGPSGPDRPAWLPEKFKSPEDLAQAYGQLEQRLGQLGRSPAPAAPAQAGQPAPQPTAPVDIQTRLMQEYASTGQVSAESRQEFTQRTGLSDEFIDQHLAYLQHQGATAQQMAVQRLGGEAAVRELTDWAKAHLSADERAAFNRLVYSGDPAASQLAIDGVAAKYEAAVGRSPRIIAGRRPQSDYGGITPFQSEQELRAAQKDPRYKQDPAYRDQVMDRLNAAMKLGILR